jgi:flagellar biogenesis protein FliO
MTSLFASAGLSLASILALLFAAAWAVQKLRSRNWGKSPSAPNPIQIIATRTLGPSSALLIIEAQNHRFLVSTHRGALTPIGLLGNGDEDSK